MLSRLVVRFSYAMRMPVENVQVDVPATAPFLFISLPAACCRSDLALRQQDDGKQDEQAAEELQQGQGLVEQKSSQRDRDHRLKNRKRRRCCRTDMLESREEADESHHR